MGKRIYFYRNNQGKGLKELISDNFPAFREWYLGQEESSLKDFNEPFGNEHLIRYLRKGSDFRSDFDTLEDELVGAVVTDFIGYYCDWTDEGRSLVELFGPMVYTRRYSTSSKLVAKTNDTDFIRLWSFITQGRSLKYDGPFRSYDDENSYGFLSIYEVSLLTQKIETHFGDIETIIDRYWTAREKKEYKKALSRANVGFFSLSGHNPVSTGLECLLDAFSELDGRNTEILSGIDR